MDNQMLISMMGSTVSTRDNKSTQKSGDANMFSQALEEATSSNHAASEETQEIIAEKNTPKTDAERRNAETKDAQVQAKAAQQARVAQDPKMIGSRAYLYQIMYKNPDAMSLAEKQALKLDTPATSVGLRELQTMMSERGVNMRSLSFSQMANLTKSSSPANVTQFLESLAQEAKAEGKEESQKGTKGVDAGMAASSSAKAEGKAAPDNSLAAAAIRQADQAAPTQQANQAMKRKQVIDQIVTHMELRNFANRDEIQLKLNPEYLGDLKIQLTRGEGGEVSAKFVTTSDETREVLNDSKSELRKRVEEKGLRFGSIDVDFVEELA